jgi:hypothetical protein
MVNIGDNAEISNIFHVSALKSVLWFIVRFWIQSGVSHFPTLGGPNVRPFKTISLRSRIGIGIAPAVQAPGGRPFSSFQTHAG